MSLNHLRARALCQALPARPSLAPFAAGAAALFALALLSGNAQAQFTFGQSYAGPTKGLVDGTGANTITEGDVLRASNPGGVPALASAAPPSIDVSAGFGPPLPGLGLAGHAPCVVPGGNIPGIPCGIEVDALSHGFDDPMDPAVPPRPGGEVFFSVDEFAAGFPTFVPGVASESPFADASGDAFCDVGIFLGGAIPPLCPGVVAPGNVGVVDGDGFPSGSGFTYPGVGFREPNLAGPPPTTGDNLDMMDAEAPFGFFPTYYSLDSGFLDPLTGLLNSGSAAAHGFLPGDVIVSGPGGPPALFAPAFMLGLDFFGPGTDDLDALILFENGTGVYEPPVGPYSWIGAAGTDMLIFSVRRGSALIGTPDAFCGVPIEEGDLLLPSPPGAGIPPGIWIAAENLGLLTARTHGVIFGDDLDAADSLRGALIDCNGNGIEDAVDIVIGLAADIDKNGVPDTCQTYFEFCFCDVIGTAPCGNESAVGANEGCLNSTGVGARLSASGSNSLALQGGSPLILSASQGRPGKNCVWLQGATVIASPFRDGILCTGNPTIRLPGFGCHPFPIGTLDATGSLATNDITYGFGIVAADTCKGGTIVADVGGAGIATRNYQLWFRDGMGPCNTGSNLTNAVQVNWVP